MFLFVFLPLTLSIHLAVRNDTWRNAVLLCASLVFYFWGEPDFIWVLIPTTALNFLFGVMIERASGTPRAARIMAAAVICNVGLLCGFKYLHFLCSEVLFLPLGLMGIDPQDIPKAHLLLGISFFTFHAICYIVDVYRKDSSAEPSFMRFILYMFLFPHMMAGPIVRYSSIKEDLGHRRIGSADLVEGINRFVIGLGKKVLLADRLALTADQIFSAPTNSLTMVSAWIGIFCYTLQIYFDFSGYSDMAIGLARMLGFRFPENFRYPYTAVSMREFPGSAGT